MQRPASATSWQIAVPNGTYLVHLVSGDPSYTDSVYRVNVQGTLAVSGYAERVAALVRRLGAGHGDERRTGR